jgi:hypothetical protein
MPRRPVANNFSVHLVGTTAVVPTASPHRHSDAPPLDSAWCSRCCALLDWAIVADEGEVQP